MTRQKIRVDPSQREKVETSDKGSVSICMDELRDKSNQQAAEFLYHRYFGQLVSLLRHRINNRARSTSDSEDMAQYVLSEVLTKLRDGKYPALQNRDHLWAIMIRIGELRTKKVWSYLTAVKRDVRTTQSGEERDLQVPSKTEVSPALVAEIEDLIGCLCNRLSSEEYRKILIWELQGHSPQDIKELLEDHLNGPVTDRTLRRWRQKMRSELQAMYPKDSQA